MWELLASSINKFVRENSKQVPVAVIQYAKLVSCVATHDRTYVPLRSDFRYESLRQSCDHIQLAFSTLREYIEKRRKVVPEGTRFNVCYVADGGDTESGDCLVQRLEKMQDFDSHNVAFTTLACGSRFPTNTMLVLRKVFHDTASVETPLLTPVDEASVDFEERFETVVPHLLGESNVFAKLEKGVRRVPWQTEKVDEVAVGSWFVIEQEKREELLIVDGVEAEFEDGALGMANLTELGRQWIRGLHTSSAFGEVRQEAGMAVEYFESLLRIVMDQAAQRKNMVEKDDVEMTMFARRLQRKRELSTQHDARRIMNELKTLAQHALTLLSDEQLAQRLAIGTKESKYLDRAVKWKGALTAEGFCAARERFKKVYTGLLPELRRCVGKDPYRSVVSMESNVDVLTETTFLLNLYDKVVSSQFALVECFPVVGLALKTYVSEGTTINPWLVRVDAIPRLTRFLDTASVYTMVEDGMYAKISAGLDEVEEVSAICPLIAPDTAAVLGPILRTKLYQIMMTFQVTRNMDTVDKASHLALLAAVLTFLLKEDPCEWRDELIESVVFTASVLLGDGRNANAGEKESAGKSYVEFLSENPAHAMVTAHPELPKKCESVSKALLAVAVLKMQRGEGGETNWEEIWHRIVAEFVGRAVLASNPERNWEEWFSLNDLRVSSSISFESVFGHDGTNEDDMQLYASVSEIVRGVDKFDKYADNVDVEVGGLTFRLDKVISANATSNGPTDWIALLGFESQYMKDCAMLNDENRIRSYVAHAVLHSGSYGRAVHTIEAWNESIEKTVITRLASGAKLRAVQKVKDVVALSAQSRMIEFMRSVHRRGLVLPMTTDQIRSERFSRYGLETTKEDLKLLRYDDEAGLCRGACQNNACARFLISDSKFSEHLVNTSYSGGRPTIAVHRAVQANWRKPVSEIEKIILSGSCSRSGQLHLVVKSIGETYNEEVRGVLPAIRNGYRLFHTAKKKN